MIKTEEEEYLACQHCGTKFIGRKNQKYCSTQCRIGAQTKKYKRPLYKKKCPYCGSEFETHNKKTMYCSSTCAARKYGDEVRGEYFCEYCGKPRHSDHPNRNRFCSRACASKSQRYGTIEQEQKAKQEALSQNIQPTRICPVCSKLFNPLHSNRRYCSSECGHQATLAQQRDKWKRAFVPRIVVCKECGKRFTTTCGNPRKAFCSDECSQTVFRRKDKETRKQQMKAAYREPVNIKRLYRRDRGICRICGLPVPNTTEPTNPWAATKDHVIPLSKGGEHSMGNCQLAHRMCNSLKLDTLDEFSIDWEEKMKEEPGRWDDQLYNLMQQISPEPPGGGQISTDHPKETGGPSPVKIREFDRPGVQRFFGAK